MASIFSNLTRKVNPFLLLRIRRFSSNAFTTRSHNCGQLTSEQVGSKVTLYGWIKYKRLQNTFLILQDCYGTTQVILPKKIPKTVRKTLTNESVIKIVGTVNPRPAGQTDERCSTGQIEVIADDMEIISLAKTDLPILSRDDQTTNENLRLKYRYLELRSNEMQSTLRFRSKLNQLFRNKLINDFDFVECETPTLFKGTPGGANEFIVPTRTPDKFYSLVQSPQQLKQLLMIAQTDRYFQICRCYRDESTRPDRQPEFTQLDIEMSFTTHESVMSLVESLLRHIWPFVRTHNSSFANVDPFNKGELDRMSFSEAFDMYGTDKPDTRFDWRLQEISNHETLAKVPNTDVFYGFAVPFNIQDTVREELIQETLTFMERNNYDCTLTTTSSEENPDGFLRQLNRSNSPDFTVFTARGSKRHVCTVLGRLRVNSAKMLHSLGEEVYGEPCKFLWIINFPLFTKNDDGSLESSHHPFTAPSESTKHLLWSDPTQVIGQHFDLVLNGQEIAGGSMRIHDHEIQKYIFENVLNVEQDVFNYFIDALHSGCPPHGGIAFGMDRLVSLLLGRSTIREVIAFPKSSTGRDVMTDCPDNINEKLRTVYHLETNSHNK